MKYTYVFTAVLLFLASACDKEEPAPLQTPEEVVKKEISEALTAESDLTEFVAAFENVELEAADVVDGITIFAPENGTSNGRIKDSNSVSALTPEILKGHMIKGMIDALELEDGDVLEALDGKKLFVSVIEGEIRINSVLVSGKDLVKQAKYIIHKVETIIEAVNEEDEEEEEPATVIVTVHNSTKWTPEAPTGEPEAGAVVSFYSSQEAYATGDDLFTGETDSAGKITFSDAVAGSTYFIVAQKGALSNIHNRSDEPVGGVYLGWIPEGLFMSQEEIDAHAVQPGSAPGNFKWRDVNADGVINNDDRGFVPDERITAVAGSGAEAVVFIGYQNNDAMFVKDGADALEKLQAARVLINSIHKTLMMVDGILSDDAPCAEGSDWCVFDNFALTESNPDVLKIWNDAYSAIGTLNLLLRDTPGLSFAEKEMVLNQALGLRAYVYLELVQYFGGVPIPEGVWFQDEARATSDEIYQLISTDLQSAADVLPSAPSAERYLLTADAARALAARAALFQGDYTRAAEFAGQVIDGMLYELAGTTDEAFLDAANGEIIWDFSSTLPPGFQEYFYGRSFGPAIRLAEVYLILAEAQLEMDNLIESRATLDVIRSRRGMSDAAGMSKDELRVELRETWRVEMTREGNRFVNLVRWEMAESVLIGNGYVAGKNSLLPIPSAVMVANFNIHQNPGY